MIHEPVLLSYIFVCSDWSVYGNSIVKALDGFKQVSNSCSNFSHFQYQLE
jgi:hypothetical protein